MDFICVICLENINTFTEKYTLNCEHFFHKHCINNYYQIIYQNTSKITDNKNYNIKCPICKQITYYNEYIEHIDFTYLDIIQFIFFFIILNNIIHYLSIIFFNFGYSIVLTIINSISNNLLYN